MHSYFLGELSIGDAMLTSPESDAPAYPGANASAADVIALADVYRAAALLLFEQGPRGKRLSRAPFRLCAIQAIELYLNAELLAQGMAPEQVRGHLHNLTVRMRHATENGLVLRVRTAQHLEKLTEDREYLVTRYGPELAANCSEPTRLMATLEEVARKASQRVLAAA